MEIRERYFISLLLLPLIVGLVFLSMNVYEKNSWNDQRTKLLNEIATRDKTIEVKEGVYRKLALDTENVKAILGDQQKQNKLLLQQIDEGKEKLVTATNASLYWKQQFEIAVVGTSTVVVPSGNGVVLPGAPPVLELSSGPVNFGFVSVLCRAITTAPPTFKISLDKGKTPLGISLALTQGEDGSWKSYVTSSDPNVGIDISSTAIDTSKFKSKWYEKISLSAEVGVGGGVLGGVGAQYRFGNFDVGPRIWSVTTDRSSVFYGASLTWYPFAR